ncbi:MAG: helix-turn-helix transcriptional regulator [Symploca sp. SIO2G7]|nr:helix-turn-helix transcriptional regulator [Symploca sp. SIO2G7]
MDIDTARDCLKKIVQDYDLNIASLSAATDIHHNSLYRFLKGEQDISLSRWLKLLQALPPKAREEYISVMFAIGDINRLSSEAKKSILFRMVSEIVDSSKV